MNVNNRSVNGADASAAAAPTSEDVRSIGEIIRDTRNLTADNVESILQYQREHGAKFGEAAIALGFATSDDVLHALAQQFNYAFGSPELEATNPELITLTQPFSQQAEAFRAIRAQILLRAKADGDMPQPRMRRAIAVVSPNTGDGKTFFCANLAIALAQRGGRTLVVDGDLRGPRLHEVFGVDNKSGLSGLLIARRGESVIKPVKPVPNLYVLPVGVCPPNPLELVEGPTFAVLMQELTSKFDHVVVDTPAAQYGADCAVIAARCGAAVVVARKGASRVEDLESLVETLSAANAQLTGVVMNEF